MRKFATLLGAPLILVLLLSIFAIHGNAQTSRPSASVPAQAKADALTTDSPVSPDDTPEGTNPFALTLEWERCPAAYCEIGWYASPAVADLDENGTPEVYWGGYTLLAVDGASGMLLGSVPGNAGRIWPSIVAADLEGDGVTEIIVANASGEVIVYGENLVRRLGWPRQPFGEVREIRSLAVADLDNDGVQEIIVCSTRRDNQWAVLEHDGTLRAGWPQMIDDDTQGYASGCYNQNIAAGDIDGDGRSEIVGPNDTHYVAAFNGDGSPVRAHAMYGQNKPWARVGLHVDHAVDLRGYANCGDEHRPNMANSAPVIGDLNSDGKQEVIFVGNVYDCAADPYRSLYEMPFVLSGDRTRWNSGGFNWTTIPAPRSDAAPLSEDYNRIEMNLPNPVLADLDGDGFPEILHTSYDGKLHAWSLGKAEHGNWPYDLQPSEGDYLRFGSEPVVADLDNDGKAEVLLNTWTENDSNAPGQLLILSHAGDLLQAIDLPWNPDDGRGGALGAPTLANLDRDDNLEIVIGTLNRGLVAYEIADSANARVLWATGRGNFARNGFAANTWQAAPQRVELAATVDRAIAAPGASLAYRIEVNNGASVETAVALTVQLPAEASLSAASIAATTGEVQNDGARITWQVNLDARTAATLTWSMTVKEDAPRPGAAVAIVTATQAGEPAADRQIVTLVAPLQNMLPAISR